MVFWSFAHEHGVFSNVQNLFLSWDQNGGSRVKGKTTVHSSDTFTATGMGIRCWPRQWRPLNLHLLISPKPWSIIKWRIWEPEGPYWLFCGLIGWLSVFCSVSAPISRPVREKTRRIWKVSWTGNSIGKMRSAPSHLLAILINIKGTSIFVCEY